MLVHPEGMDNLTQVTDLCWLTGRESNSNAGITEQENRTLMKNSLGSKTPTVTVQKKDKSKEHVNLIFLLQMWKSPRC